MNIRDMKLTDSLPTAFARQIAVGVDLLPVDYDLHTVNDYDVDKKRLAQFQQLSVAGTIDDAMLAYHGIDLKERQITALQLIYKTTKPWLAGHVVGELLSRMESLTTDSKAAKEIAQMVLEIMDPPLEGDGGVDHGGRPKRGLLVSFASLNGDVIDVEAGHG